MTRGPGSASPRRRRSRTSATSRCSRWAPASRSTARSRTAPTPGTPNFTPTQVSVGGTVSGTVPATLALAINGPASFGSFTPGVANTYTASTTATVTSTAGDATLSVVDPDPAHPGHLVNG